ncbi:MAG: L-aspartate oxidase [Oscillospiraceae bacterium]|nr:L-aspartate oxidase [Oscillospiraceae bacterium]
MKYAINSDTKISKTYEYDVVIVGAGLAGLYAALNLDEKLNLLMIAKENLDASSSWLAQGGIAAAINRDDTPELHLNDTIVAGAGECDTEAVEVLVNEGPSDIETLVKLNVPFDLDEYGEFHFTKEGGHKKSRVVHAGGDATGRETIRTLAYMVAKKENISFSGHTCLYDIVVKDDMVVGVVISKSDGEFHLVLAKSVIIATGGIGQVYKSTTNPPVATGDGIAAAIRCGAKVTNLEFIQFHPTGLWDSSQSGNEFLISEAVRGEGAVLVNSKGERFMTSEHELGELAPRDIVARGIAAELRKSGENHVYLDITSKSEEFLKKRFPTIYGECLNRGIDIAKALIPVHPVQHYLMGGIETDVNGCTNIKGLYACGEAANTGVHGANRLASNSMLECLVFGRRAAEFINSAYSELTSSQPLDMSLSDFDFGTQSRTHEKLDYISLRRSVKELMSEYCYVIRTNEGLEYALKKVSEILVELERIYDSSTEYLETLNIATVAKAVLEAALSRDESIGSHFIEKAELSGHNSEGSNGPEGEAETVDFQNMFGFDLDGFIRSALEEDVGTGDVTTLSTVAETAISEGSFIAKEPGVVCGLSVAKRVFELLDDKVVMTCFVSDGDKVTQGTNLAEIKGHSRAILTGERVALNLLQHMSGVASKTAEAVEKVSGEATEIKDTRKTTPGFRAFDKYAVKCGGGTNHRFNLSDGVLIKDNHIKAAGGITKAVELVRKRIASHSLDKSLQIEVETERIEQVREALDAKADIIMLDNMSLELMRDAVNEIAGRALTEASGNMGDNDLLAVAKTGVDFISIGALTHSVRAMDISLKFR